MASSDRVEMLINVGDDVPDKHLPEEARAPSSRSCLSLRYLLFGVALVSLAITASVILVVKPHHQNVVDWKEHKSEGESVDHPVIMMHPISMPMGMKEKDVFLSGLSGDVSGQMIPPTGHAPQPADDGFFNAMTEWARKNGLWADFTALLFPKVEFPNQGSVAAGPIMTQGGLFLTYHFVWSWGWDTIGGAPANVRLSMSLSLKQDSSDQGQLFSYQLSGDHTLFKMGPYYTSQAILPVVTSSQFQRSGHRTGSSSPLAATTTLTSGESGNRGQEHPVGHPMGWKGLDSAISQAIVGAKSETVSEIPVSDNNAVQRAVSETISELRLQIKATKEPLHPVHMLTTHQALFPAGSPLLHRGSSTPPLHDLNYDFFNAVANHAKFFARWENPDVLLFPTLQWPHANSVRGSGPAAGGIHQEWDMSWDWPAGPQPGSVALRFQFNKLSQTTADRKRQYTYSGAAIFVRLSDAQPMIYTTERRWNEAGTETM